MKKIGSYEAKTHLSSLLDKVASGESYTITKHGVPVAQLIPAPGSSRKDVQNVITELLQFRKNHKLGVKSIQSMIRVGRKS